VPGAPARQARTCAAQERPARARPQVLLGAEPAELGQDDLDELADDEDEYFRLGGAGEHFRDYAALELKGDHGNRRGAGPRAPGRAPGLHWRRTSAALLCRGGLPEARRARVCCKGRV